MGKRRVVKFMRRIVRHIDAASLANPERLEPLLRQALSSLPDAGLRSAIESDIPRFLSLLLETAKQARLEDSTRVAEQQQQQEQVQEQEQECLLLKACQGPILANVSKAVEAVVTGMERNPGSQAEEWVAACRRVLLVSSSSSSAVPLPLCWAYASLELRCAAARCFASSGFQRPVGTIISEAEALLRLLTSIFVASRVNGATSVAALAPIVAVVHDAAAMVSASSSASKTELKALRHLVQELVACLAVCKRGKSEGSRAGPQLDASLEFRSIVVAAKGVQEFSGWHGSKARGFRRLFPLLPNHLNEPKEAWPVRHWSELVAHEIVLLRLLVAVLEQRCRNKAATDFLQELNSLAIHTASLLDPGVFTDSLLMNTNVFRGQVLDSDEENKIQSVLLDAVLSSSTSQPTLPFASFLKRLLLVRKASDYYRSQGERTKALDVTSRISGFEFPSGFLKWLELENEKLGLPGSVFKGPRHLIVWLLEASDETLHGIVEATCDGKLQTEAAASAEDVDDMFVVDTAGDASVSERLGAADRAFAAAAEGFQAGADDAAARYKMDDEQQESSHSSSSDEEDEDKEANPVDLEKIETRDECKTGEQQQEEQQQEKQQQEEQQRGEVLERLPGELQQEKQHDMVQAPEQEATEIISEVHQEVCRVDEDLTAPTAASKEDEAATAEAAAAQEQKTEAVMVTPTAARQQVVSRCTRSGRKYGNFEETVASVDESSRLKKRRLAL